MEKEEYLDRELSIKFNNGKQIMTQSPTFPLTDVKNVACVIDRAKIKNRITITGYGEQKGTVYFNTGFMEILELRAALKLVMESGHHDETFNFHWIRFHGMHTDESGRAKYFSMNLKRDPERKYPWLVEIGNGTAVPAKGKVEGQVFAASGSYAETGHQAIYLDDLTLYAMVEEFMEALREAETGREAFARAIQTEEFVSAYKKQKQESDAVAPVQVAKTQSVSAVPQRNVAPQAKEQVQQAGSGNTTLRSYRIRIVGDELFQTEGDGYVAECEVNGKKLSVVFDGRNEQIQTLAKSHALFHAAMYPDVNRTGHVIVNTIQTE